ncbi:hypothetical protein UCREL1_8583 [Eutypa lata UCREL1]|uniref:Uncharacterized protein n=1 Tax=Eutypa lata (strain UCR-EL1) TaxID=1287681 RepID=M7SDZ5_EUTLA|nr:hypothetical protein UCREL1_8583 [Eutypa lata UCREL1]
MELGLDAPVPHAVDLELEAQAGAVDDHLEGEVEVVELDAAGGGEAGEQGARHGAQACGGSSASHAIRSSVTISDCPGRKFRV